MNMTLGEFARHQRKDILGLSQEAMSLRAGVSQPRWSKIEKSDHRITPIHKETIEAVAKATLVPYEQVAIYAGYGTSVGESLLQRVGGKIALYRVRAGYSVDQLSSLTNLPVSLLERLELGLVELLSSQLYRLSLLFDVSMESFFAHREGIHRAVGENHAE